MQRQLVQVYQLEVRLGKSQRKEVYDLIKYTVEKIDERIPVIAGTGSNNTRTPADFSKKVSEIKGLDGPLVVTPYYNKATLRKV